MDKLRAFILGIIEFRSDITTHFDESLIEAYDTGREFSHVVTLRYFDND